MQLSISSQLPGLVRGQLVGSHHEEVTRYNARAATFTLTVTYASGGMYTVTVNGRPYNGGPVDYSAVVGPIAGITDSATTTAALLAALKADPVANSIMAFSAVGNVITGVSRRQDNTTSITPAVSGAGAALVGAQTVTEEPLEAGLIVAKDPAMDLAVRRPLISVAVIPDGVTLWPKIDNSFLGGNLVWPGRFDVQLVRKGIVGVLVEVAVNPEDPVFFRVNANGALATLGALRNDADGGNAVALANAGFVQSAPAGGVAPLRIRLN